MNCSLQIVRGIGALALCAAASAYALTQPAAAPDGHEVAVAHSRLTIETLRDAGQPPRYLVVSVRVGAPIAEPPEQVRRTVMRVRVSETRS
jgi:hypothetical protein